MTVQASSPSLFAPAWEGRERSFWRQLLGAIMEGRQRKADETIRDYLRRHRGERPDAFRSELERRLLVSSRQEKVISSRTLQYQKPSRAEIPRHVVGLSRRSRRRLTPPKSRNGGDECR
jgi:hypothetical protein